MNAKTERAAHLASVRDIVSCARRVLHLAPVGEECPRLAVEAAEAWLANPCKETRAAAAVARMEAARRAWTAAARAAWTPEEITAASLAEAAADAAASDARRAAQTGEWARGVLSGIARATAPRL